MYYSIKNSTLYTNPNGLCGVLVSELSDNFKDQGERKCIKRIKKKIIFNLTLLQPITRWGFRITRGLNMKNYKLCSEATPAQQVSSFYRFFSVVLNLTFNIPLFSIDKKNSSQIYFKEISHHISRNQCTISGIQFLT